MRQFCYWLRNISELHWLRTNRKTNERQSLRRFVMVLHDVKDQALGGCRPHPPFPPCMS